MNPFSALTQLVVAAHHRSIWKAAHLIRDELRCRGDVAKPTLCCRRLTRTLEAVQILGK